MLRVSSTQDQTYARCKRLWYLQSVLRVPSPPRGSFDFGTCLHSVCERYLLADDLGRDKSGEPVDLFPKDWDVVDGRRLPPVEASTIKRLIPKAIEEGVLVRAPGREIEHWFAGQIIDGVEMVGKIDVLTPTEIQDHKSTSSMRWAETTDSLKQNLQMLNYARQLIDADPSLGWVNLRHNVYCKDPHKLEVRKVEARVSRGEIEKNWRRLEGVAQQMLDIAEAMPKWSDVEGPSQPDACSAYGGCPMRKLCGGMESLDAYKARVQRQIENHDPNLQNLASWDDKWGRVSSRSNEPVDIFQRRLATKGAKPVSADIPINSAPPPAPEPAQPAVEGAPPWAVAECRACQGKGFNTKGSPCMICDSVQRKAGGVTSGSFAIETSADGSIIWEPLDGSGTGGQAEAAISMSEPKASERVEYKDPVEEAPKPEPVSKRAPDPVLQKGGNKGGRKPRGMVLYINCVPQGVKTVVAEQLFNDLGAEMAKDQGVGSFWDLDIYKRREAWKKVPDQMAERLGTMHIVARNADGSPDLKAFIEAIRAVAQPGNLVEGLS